MYKKITKNCECCGKEFVTGKGNKKYCSAECGSIIRRKKYHQMNKFQSIYMAPSTKGALNELRICVDLLEKGFEVFRSVSPSCSCDLAILKDKKLIRVEVTSGWVNPQGKLLRNKSKKESDKNDILATVYLGNKIDYLPKLP